MEAKDKILRAAKKEFYLKGLKGTTVRSIAEGSGEKGPLIIYHYKNKENLFLEVLKSVAKKNFSDVKDIFTEPSSKEDFFGQLEKFSYQIVNTMASDIPGILLAMNEAEMPTSKVYKHVKDDFNVFNNYLVNFIIQGQQKGYTIPDLDHSYFFVTYWGIITQRLRMNHAMKASSQNIANPEVQQKWTESFIRMIRSYLE